MPSTNAAAGSGPDGETTANQQPDAQQGESEQDEAGIEEREAYEYWGYLFKPDKTGTDRLKALLRGLKHVVVRSTMHLTMLMHC